MVSNLPPPFRLSAHPHPRLFPAEPPPSPSFPPPNPLPTLLRSPSSIFNPHPLPGKPKNRGRRVLTAARGVGGLRLCPAPSQDHPPPAPPLACNCHPHSTLWGSRLEKPDYRLGLGPQVLGGALYKEGGVGEPPCLQSLGAAGRRCRRVGGWGAVLMPQSHWARERRAKRRGLPRHFPPLSPQPLRMRVRPCQPALGPPRPAPV